MNATNVVPLPGTTYFLLDAFDHPVSFHRCLVPLTGSVNAALMLSQAIWVTQTSGRHEHGWFVRSQAEWREETGLSCWEQRTARRLLREGGFLEERRVGMPAKLCFRVRSDQVMRALQRHAAHPHRGSARRDA